MTARALLPVCAGMLLAACSTIAPQSARISAQTLALWQQRQDVLADVDHWDIKGRMAVRTADDGGSATFVWERLGEEHHIEMFGPFGSGRVSISQSPGGAVLEDGDNEPVEAGSAEELLYWRVGWHVPFESLKYWLKGVPAPLPHEGLILDERGRALGFRQGGWDIAILDYAAAEPLDLPRKVFIKALPGTVHLVDDKGEDLGDRLDVRVVLRRWQVLSGRT